MAEIKKQIKSQVCIGLTEEESVLLEDLLGSLSIVNIREIFQTRKMTQSEYKVNELIEKIYDALRTINER